MSLRRERGFVLSSVATFALDTAVRLALGASPVETVRRAMLQGLAPVMVGGVAGGAAAVAIVSLGRSYLFGIDGADIASLAAGALIVFTACAAACLAPALHASRTDPFSVLRS